MKALTTTFVLVISLFATQLYPQEIDSYKSAVNTKRIYSFPDSIFMYSYSIEGTKLGIVGKQYYSLNDNVLQVKYYADYGNYSSYYLHAQDLFFYNEQGLADSAIIQSSIDGDWDIYAIKKVYTYAEDLLTSESIFWDMVNDSINDNWEFSKKILYSYDNEKRPKEETTQYGNGEKCRNAFKTSHSYVDNPKGGSIRIDSTFNNSSNSTSTDSIEWVPNSVTNSYFNNNGICIKIKSWQCSDDSDMVSLTTVLTEKMYNNLGQLIMEDRSTPNTRPVYRNLYEYDSIGQLKTQTFTENFFEGFFKTYSYEYFYKPEVTTSISVEKIKFRIFPNPVNEILNIELQGNTASICMLFSSNGQLIKTLKLSQGINTFDINFLKTGMYYIQISTKEGSVTQKIIKK